MKELTKEQKLEAIWYMIEKLQKYQKGVLGFPYKDVGLCSLFDHYYDDCISDYPYRIRFKKQNQIALFPELFNRLYDVIGLSDYYPYAWESENCESRIKFLNNLQKQINYEH